MCLSLLCLNGVLEPYQFSSLSLLNSMCFMCTTKINLYCQRIDNENRRNKNTYTDIQIQ